MMSFIPSTKFKRFVFDLKFKMSTTPDQVKMVLNGNMDQKLNT